MIVMKVEYIKLFSEMQSCSISCKAETRISLKNDMTVEQDKIL